MGINPFCCLKKNKQIQFDILRENKLFTGLINKKQFLLNKWDNVYFELYKNYLLYKKNRLSKKFKIIDLTKCEININLYDKIGKDYCFQVKNNIYMSYFSFDNNEIYEYFITVLGNSNILNKKEFQKILNIKKINPWIQNNLIN